MGWPAERLRPPVAEAVLPRMLFAPAPWLLPAEELRLEEPEVMWPEVLLVFVPELLPEDVVPDELAFLAPVRCWLVAPREDEEDLLPAFFRPRPVVVDGCFM